MTKTSATTTQESWASTLSDYILQRRQQTKLAYTQSQSQNPATNPDANKRYNQQASELLPPNQDDWLFKIVFIALAKQLEEGHTVLTLTCSNQPAYELSKSDMPVKSNIITGMVNGEQTSLYGWQQTLIDPLAAPLFALLDEVTVLNSTNNIDDDSANKDSDNNPIFKQFNQLFKQGAQLWAQTTVSSHDKIMLAKRLEAVRQLYALLQRINYPVNTALGDEPEPSTSSFNKFITLIKNNHLFSLFDHKNSLSNINQKEPYQNNSPIIYTLSNNNQKKTLTFWLHRTWQAEYNLAKNVNNILKTDIKPLAIEIPDSLNEQQVAAIHVANNHAFSIITGGPGTGKTYTVAQLVIALQQAQKTEAGSDTKMGATNTPVRFSSDSASLALAAPTGKAAQRMQESLQAALDDADVDMQLQDAKTIHRLLGIGQNGRPRYHADNPLGEDIIIVDEASMLGVELANHLVSAIKQGARLILLGDANQLAAVDAGAVLADLCHIPSLQPIHVTLTESRRFGADSGIGQLAQQINQPDVNIAAIWQLLREDAGLSFYSVRTKHSITSLQQNSPSNQNNNQDSTDKNSLSNTNLNRQILNQLSCNYQNYLNKIKLITANYTKTESILKPNDSHSENDISLNELMTTFNQFRILTAGHHGDWGDHNLNDYLTQWHKSELKLPLGKSPWFHGRPVMVLQNNYELGLFNGDIGICLETSRGLEVFFETKTQGIAVNLLNDDLMATAYAITIHKSQGSEFDHVAITFDHNNARLLSKELIYTAVTRAKTQVTVYSTKRALEAAITTPTLRQTGLGLQFESIEV